MLYINRLHFLSLVDWYITWIVMTIDDVIIVEKRIFSFLTFIMSSMVKMIHVIHQSTRLKKCSRLIYIMTQYDHRWRHKCKKCVYTHPSPFGQSDKPKVIRHVEAPKPKGYSLAPLQKFQPAGNFSVNHTQWVFIMLDYFQFTFRRSNEHSPTRREDFEPKDSSNPVSN